MAENEGKEEKKKIDEEFYICDKCGYRGGFHVTFWRLSDPIEKNNFRIKIKCPECHQLYDIEWFCSLHD